MKRVISFYTELSSPWICVAAYLWLLEVRAAIGTDSETVVSWLADSSAILLTLVFWTGLGCLPLAVIGALVGKSRVLVINGVIVKACLIAVTAMHFVRWLLNFQSFVPRHDVGLIFLIFSAVVLAIIILARRKKNRIRSSGTLPTLEDCFLLGALPVLLGAIGLIVVQAFGEFLSRRHAVITARPKVAADATRNSQPNIILIVSDALRARSMSLYGHTRKTTPHIDRWAQAATVYLQAHTNSTSTKPSMTTILTGKHPLTHGRLTKVQPPVRSDENLLRLLREHGYSVEAVTSNEDGSLRLLGFDSYLSKTEHAAFEFLTLNWLRLLGIYPTPTGGRIYQNLSQFLWFLGYPGKTSYYGNAEDTLKIARNSIRRARPPFFLMIQLHEPHDPYDAPPPFRGTYTLGSRKDLPASVTSSHYDFYASEFQLSVDFYRDQYEESIRYLDQQLGNFFRDVDGLLAGRKYFLAVTADHGESFDRGYMNHGQELFESSTHVPLVVRFPGQTSGETLSGFTQSVDIAPTILAAAGIDVPEWMDGRTLVRGKTPPIEPTLALNYKDPVGQTTYPLPTKIAIWESPYKLIVSCESGRMLLYNLGADPKETVDLSASARTVVRDLRRVLKAKLDKQVKGPKVSCLLNDEP